MAQGKAAPDSWKKRAARRKIGRHHKVDTLYLIGALARGKTQQQIAAEVNVSYSTLRRRLSRHVRDSGFKSVEQAVAVHTARQIQQMLPTALHPVVDTIMLEMGRLR